MNTTTKSFPRHLLRGIYWTFEKKYRSKERFNSDVDKMQRETLLFLQNIDQVPSKKIGNWRPEKLILNSNKANIKYYSEEEENYKIIELESETAEGFTQTDLLYQINNGLSEILCDSDHRYFEGLRLVRSKKASQLPTYELELGS